MNKISTRGPKREELVNKDLSQCCEWVKSSGSYSYLCLTLDREFTEMPIFHQWLKFCTKDLKLAIEYDEAKREITIPREKYMTVYHTYLALVIFRFVLEKKSYAEEVLKIYGVEECDPVRAMVYVWLVQRQTDATRGLFNSEQSSVFPNKIADYWDFLNLIQDKNFNTVNKVFGSYNLNLSTETRTEMQKAIIELKALPELTIKDVKRILAIHDIS